MLICPKCGKKEPRTQDANFCDQCGSKLKQVEDVSPYQNIEKLMGRLGNCEKFLVNEASRTDINAEYRAELKATLKTCSTLLFELGSLKRYY